MAIPGVDIYAYRELVKDKGGMRHGTRYFYSNLNHSRMCMWEEVERQNREEDMKQALHERIALYKSLGQYWDNLRNENKRALVKSCLNAEDLQNFIGKNTPVIEFLTKLTPKVLSEYTLLVCEYGYFLSGPRFLEIAQSDTLKLGSEKFFSFLDGASESTWLLGGSPKVEHVLDHCMEVLKIGGDGDVIASSCLRIEQKILEGYIQAEADKEESRNRRAQKKKEKNAGKKNRIVQGISGLLNTNTVDNSTKGDAKIQGVLVSSDVGNLEVEAKVVGEARSTQIDELGSQTLDSGTGMARDYCAISSESLIAEEARQGDGASMFEPLAQPHSGEEDQDQCAKDVSGSATARTMSQLQTPNAKSKKQEAAGPSSPSPGVFSSVASSNEPGGSSSTPSGEAAVPQTMAMQIRAMQDMMKELINMHKELQKQVTMMEVAEDPNNDAMWTLLQEEISEQVTGLIKNNDFQVMLEESVKKDLADVKEAFVSAITPTIEKSQKVHLAVFEYCQSEVGKEEVNQLEALFNSKLEATIAQFQTSAKEAFQDALQFGMERAVVPDFMNRCKVMFESFQKLMDTAPAPASRQHFEAAHSSLAHDLKEALRSASAITQAIGRDLADDQHTLVDLATKVHLSWLVSAHMYDEAFRDALESNDMDLLLWLCIRVDLTGLLVRTHVPLNICLLTSLHTTFNNCQEPLIIIWRKHLERALIRFNRLASRTLPYLNDKGLI